MAKQLIEITGEIHETFGYADQILYYNNYDVHDIYMSGYVYSSGINHLKKRTARVYSDYYSELKYYKRNSSSTKSLSVLNVCSKLSFSKLKISKIPNQDVYRVISYPNREEIELRNKGNSIEKYLVYLKLSDVLEFLRKEKGYIDDEDTENLLYRPTNTFKSAFIDFEPLHEEIFKLIKNNTNIPFLREWTRYLLDNNLSVANYDMVRAMYADINDPNNVYAMMVTLRSNDIIKIICDGLKSHAISIPGHEYGWSDTGSTNNLTSYLDKYNNQLIDKAAHKFTARFNPENEDFTQKEKDFFEYADYFGKLKLYGAQKNVIAAVSRSLDHERSAFIVGEMGAGKTLLATSSVYCNAKSRHINSIVMAPGHLVNKWKREIERLFPDARAVIISELSDLLRIEKELLNPLRNYPLFLVISKDTAKISYQERPTVEWDNKNKIFVCPHCGSAVITQNAHAMNKFELERDRRLVGRPSRETTNIQTAITLFASKESYNSKCSTRMPSGKAIYHPYKEKGAKGKQFTRRYNLFSCGHELWAATNSSEAAKSKWIKHPKFGWMNTDMIEDFKNWYATATVDRRNQTSIKNYYNAVVDIEENGLPKLAATRRYSIAKYIRDRFRNKIDYFIADEVHLYSSSNSMQANAFADFVRCAKKTIALTGTLLNGYADGIYHILFRLYSRSFIKKGYSYDSISKFVADYGVKKESRTTINSENTLRSDTKTTCKICPGVSPELFTNFLLDKAVFISLADMSNALPTYTEIPIAIDMDGETETQYNTISNSLRDVFQNPNIPAKDIAFIAAQKLAMYPDMPYNMAPIYDKKGNLVLTLPDAIDNPDNFVSNKDLKTLEIVREKIAKGENVLIYVNYINKTDVVDRLSKMFKRAGIKACVLTAKTKAVDREEWIDSKVKAGYRVLICNPTLVETGLDLLAFTNIIFYQTGYNLFTMRQAARRSYRLNQPNPVNVYFLYYQNTTQELILSLMANKLSAAMAIEGKFTEEGLNAMSNNDDLLTQIADSLVKNIEHKVEEGAFVSGVGRPEDDVDKSRFTLVNILNGFISKDPYSFLNQNKKKKSVILKALCA